MVRTGRWTKQNALLNTGFCTAARGVPPPGWSLFPPHPPQVLDIHRLHVFWFGSQISCLPFSPQKSVIMLSPLSKPDHFSPTPRGLLHPPQLQHPAISKSNEYCLFLTHIDMHLFVYYILIQHFVKATMTHIDTDTLQCLQRLKTIVHTHKHARAAPGGATSPWLLWSVHLPNSHLPASPQLSTWLLFYPKCGPHPDSPV